MGIYEFFTHLVCYLRTSGHLLRLGTYPIRLLLSQKWQWNSHLHEPQYILISLETPRDIGWSYHRSRGTVIVTAVIVTSIIALLVVGAGATINLIYYRVIDLKEQIYLSIRADSLGTKSIIDYLNNPIQDFSSNLAQTQNVELSKFSRYSLVMNDQAIPSNPSPFLLTDLDDEFGKNTNKIKNLVLYYNQLSTNQNEDLSIYFLRWQRGNPEDIKSAKIVLSKSENTCTAPGCTPYGGTIVYGNRYVLGDFLSRLDTKRYNYVLYFSSPNGVSYSINALDIDANPIELPSRYVSMNFRMSTSNNTLAKTMNSQVDLYQKYSINISRSLYNIQ